MEKQITIITTTYNASRHLSMYFEGILNLRKLETYQFLIIVNAPDSTEKNIANQYQQKYPGLFDIIEIPHRETIGKSINRGFQRVATPYCSFLDVDDLREKDSFLKQMDTLESNLEIDFTYGDIIHVEQQGQTEGQYKEALEFDEHEFKRNCHASPTQFFRTQLLKKIIGWDEQWRIVGDLDFQIRAAYNCKFKKTNGVMLYYTFPTNTNERTNTSSAVNLWDVENTAVGLRYGDYERIILQHRYPAIYRARKYRLDHILLGGAWLPMSKTVESYTTILKQAENDHQKFQRAYIQYMLTEYPRAKIRKLLNKFGLLESVRKIFF